MSGQEPDGQERGPARRALLLLGPTGSGKSPFGRALERLAGWPHLDFGAELRRIAAERADAGAPGGLEPSERAFVRTLVETQALFPDDALPLVRRIVSRALAGFGPDGPVVLNGVPRTVAQAVGLTDLVAIGTIVVLSAAPAVVHARVARRRAGEGPDDAGRDDDGPESVARKLALFERETRPLVAHYRQAGAALVELAVASGSDPDAQARDLVCRLG